MKAFILFTLSIVSVNCIAQNFNQDTVNLLVSNAGELQFISGEAEAGVTYKYMSYNFKDTNKQSTIPFPNPKSIEIFNREFLNLLTKNLDEAIIKSNQQVASSWKLKEEKQVLVSDTTNYIYLLNDINSTYFTAEEARKLIETLNKEAHRLE